MTKESETSTNDDEAKFEKKIYDSAAAVLRVRTKAVTTYPSKVDKNKTRASLSFEVIEVLKKPLDWDKYDDVIMWHLHRKLKKKEFLMPLRFNVDLPKDKKAPEGEMTLYLKEHLKSEYVSTGGGVREIKVKTFKLLDTELMKSISHIEK